MTRGLGVELPDLEAVHREYARRRLAGQRVTLHRSFPYRFAVALNDIRRAPTPFVAALRASRMQDRAEDLYDERGASAQGARAVRGARLVVAEWAVSPEPPSWIRIPPLPEGAADPETLVLRLAAGLDR